ncbi:MAG: 3D-(3,5/4)-trihydroxycyclohexane-1,2-dione acylhydrolase (decyclizing), partial [Acidimicrobiia bacterium]|nr:3D-(3,5/4)-trihydroxycyclohexane-1,2-dione acylhydrolase (decyclizing) [Acidimicrobiia bacterium]
VTAFAEKRGIPVVETVAGKSTLLANHPNFGGPIGVTGSDAANALAVQSDVVVAIGTRLQDFTTGSWSVFANPDVRFVSINTASWDAHKRAALVVVGDAKVTVALLDEALGEITYASEWLATSQEGMKRWNETLDAWMDRTDLEPPSYGQVIRVVNEICEPDTYVVSSAGGLPGELNMGWRTLETDTFDCEYGYSTMGYEIAGGWGAKMAHPDSDVVVWVGDGSYLMANSDVYSSVFSGHKLIIMLLDNGGFGVINRLQVDQGGEEWNNLFRDSRHEKMFRVDFVKHLESMGATAERVRTLDELPDAYRRAQEADQTYAIVMDVHEYEWTEGGAWWEVGVPEVSERAEVRKARSELEDAKRDKQRPGGR